MPHLGIRLSVVYQAKQSAADAEDPVHDPYAEDVLLPVVDDAFESGQQGCANHEQEA